MVFFLIAALIAQPGSFNAQQFPRDSNLPKRVAPAELVKNKPITKGGVEVDVLWAAVTRVETMIGNGSTTVDPDVKFTILVRVFNRSETKRMAFKGWNGVMDAVTVRDDVGNVYKLANREQSGGILIHAFRSDKMVYPGSAVIDELVFDRPVDAAKSLTVALTGSSAGIEEDFEFTIPMKDIPKAVSGEVIDANYFLKDPKAALARKAGKGPKPKNKERKKK
jgi:hypothetical protein